MSYTVTQENVLSVDAEAAVLCIENRMLPCRNPVSIRLAEAGGEELASALKQKRFLPVGSVWAAPPCGLPFSRLLVTAAPHWWDGEFNELTVLRICYEKLYALAEELNIHRLAAPFLSASYYQFPLAEAVHIGLEAAAKSPVETIFIAETPELFQLGREAYQKPKIVRYIGYYRDHGVFLLENGMYAKVDLRPEIRRVDIRPFVDTCYHTGIDPSQAPLPPEEIARLREIYETL